MSYTSEATNKANTLSAAEVDHLMLTCPWALCTVEHALDQETHELHEWLEPWEGVEPEELLEALHRGHFQVEISLDGEMRLWPNYEAYEAIPERFCVLRGAAHLGLILDVMPTQCSAGEAVH
jgi:hypothetical protein